MFLLFSFFLQVTFGPNLEAETEVKVQFSGEELYGKVREGAELAGSVAVGVEGGERTLPHPTSTRQSCNEYQGCDGERAPPCPGWYGLSAEVAPGDGIRVWL